MPVPTTMADLTVVADTCSPPGGEVVGTNVDNYFRAMSAIVRRESAKGADIASAATITPGNDGHFFSVTGTTTITGIANTWTGREIKLLFTGALQITHSSNLILPGSSNIATTPGVIVSFIQETSIPTWRAIGIQGAAVSGAGAVVLLDARAFTAITSVDFVPNSVQLSTYKGYRFRLHPNITPNTSGAVLSANLSRDAGASYDQAVGGYQGAVITHNFGAPGSTAVNSALDVGMRACGTDGFQPGSTVFGEAHIDLVTGYMSGHLFHSRATPGLPEPKAACQFFWRKVTPAGPHNAVRFSVSPGTFTGTISMFGVT